MDIAMVAGSVGGDDQGAAGDQRDEERPLVGDAAQPRLGNRLGRLLGGRGGGLRGGGRALPRGLQPATRRILGGAQALAGAGAGLLESLAGGIGCALGRLERVGSATCLVGRHADQPTRGGRRLPVVPSHG